MSKDRKSDGYYAKSQHHASDEAVPLAEQIEAVQYATRLQREIFKRWIACGKARQADANRHIVRMEAAIETLEVDRMGRGS
jgi:hypothetical protein